MYISDAVNKYEKIKSNSEEGQNQNSPQIKTVKRPLQLLNEANMPEKGELNMTDIDKVKSNNVPTIDTEVDCLGVFLRDERAVKNAIQYDDHHPKVVNPDLTYISMTSNCVTFIRDRGYMMTPVNKEESNFPIAYSIMSYKEVESTERLLRAIYRPQVS